MKTLRNQGIVFKKIKPQFTLEAFYPSADHWEQYGETATLVLKELKEIQGISFEQKEGVNIADVNRFGYITIKKAPASRDCIRKFVRDCNARFPSIGIFSHMFPYIMDTKNEIIVPHRCFEKVGGHIPQREGHLVVDSNFLKTGKIVFHRYVGNLQETCNKKLESLLFETGTIIPIVWKRREG